jgi:hypothetical protein
MQSAASFLRWWAGFTIALVAYAVGDLMLNPWLRSEHSYTLEPDITRLPELMHWGGRLLQQDHLLLLANAIAVGGLLGLVAQSVVERVRRMRKRGRDGAVAERVSVFPANAHPSTPPPA